MENLMAKYLNPKSTGSLGGIDRLHRLPSNQTRKATRAQLDSLDAYTVNKKARKRFKRNRISVINQREQFQVEDRRKSEKGVDCSA